MRSGRHRKQYRHLQRPLRAWLCWVNSIAVHEVVEGGRMVKIHALVQVMDGLQWSTSGHATPVAGVRRSARHKEPLPLRFRSRSIAVALCWCHSAIG
jgi:hypothetical protein